MLRVPRQSGSSDQGVSAVDLLETIETEIIPRIIMAHRAVGVAEACAPTRPPLSSEEVERLSQIACRHDLSGAVSFVEELCRQGMSLETILLNLVAPAARLLGDQWSDDRRTFTEVAAGLGTLHQVLHILSPSFAPDFPHAGLVVLMAAPGDEHTFGVHLLGEFIRRAGWGVHLDATMSEDALLDTLSKEHVHMLGISVSNDELLDKVAGLFTRARQASRNPDLMLMVGGALDLNAFAQKNGLHTCGPDPRDVVQRLADSKGGLAKTRD